VLNKRTARMLETPEPHLAKPSQKGFRPMNNHLPQSNPQATNSVPRFPANAVDFVVDTLPHSAVFLALTPDAEDWAELEFSRFSKEIFGVWLFDGEAGRIIVQALLDRGFRVKLNGSLT
jgi:hypothetical protein